MFHCAAVLDIMVSLHSDAHLKYYEAPGVLQRAFCENAVLDELIKSSLESGSSILNRNRPVLLWMEEEYDIF